MADTIALDAAAVDDEFETRGWSDGLPVVAPTHARVDAMLAWSDREPDHELGLMPPRHGIATIELLAINAVMAGCRPEYFPVVVTAIEAMLDPAFNLLAVQATTHPCAPCVIVNGPIATKLRINARYGAFGPGVRANATIGRAVRLILLNIGGAAPGILDRSTQGQPAKYAFCVAENEAESPWEPLHVERGFRPTDSTVTVTVTAAEGPHNLNDHVSTHADGILATLAGAMGDMGCNNAYLFGQPTLALGPEHAAILAASNMGKAEIRRSVFEHARVPRALWERGGMAGMCEDVFAGAPAVPILKAPEDLLIIVVGGFGRPSCWLPTFGDSTRAVTRAIPKRRRRVLNARSAEVAIPPAIEIELSTVGAAAGDAATCADPPDHGQPHTTIGSGCQRALAVSRRNDEAKLVIVAGGGGELECLHASAAVTQRWRER